MKINKVDTIILASVSNDPMAEIDKNLLGNISTWDYTINKICLKNKIKRLIYASSGSVYGIKKEKK